MMTRPVNLITLVKKTSFVCLTSTFPISLISTHKETTKTFVSPTFSRIGKSFIFIPLSVRHRFSKMKHSLFTSLEFQGFHWWNFGSRLGRLALRRFRWHLRTLQSLHREYVWLSAYNQTKSQHWHHHLRQLQ